MARYKYSENTKEVTDIYFDTETHGEFMGMEQGGEMKKVTTARIKEKLLGEIVLGVDWQQEVLTMTSTPPVSPTGGDRYIVGTSATGDWTGYDDYITEYTGGAWLFLAPQSRMGVFIYNDTYFVIYKDGAWEVLATLDEITELRDEVQGYRDEILNDPGFQAVSADLIGDDNIGAVAGNQHNIDAVSNNSTNINTVANNITNVNTVAGLNTEITALGARTTEIDALYAELAQIASKENTANKKTTLAENSDVFFPTQQAVNEGLNQTMAEIMGFAPRNLMTLFGTATVAETFAELRARAITGDFSTLRLGDYVDLPSLTIGADSVNPTVYPARTINNDYNRLRVEIVGFDDYLNVGNTATPAQHHVTMMFKDVPTTAPFNETDMTTGDYPGSMLFHWLHEQIEPALISAIGIEPRAVNRRIGAVANWGLAGAEKIFLPTNVNIFGTTGFSHPNYGTGTQTQFALFAMNPNKKMKKLNGSRNSWWLAEPSASSPTTFCYATGDGIAYDAGASFTCGVVPTFLI